MLKNLVLFAGAAAAASLPQDMAPRAESAKILMTIDTSIMLATFDGSKFNIGLKKPVDIAATWVAYSKPDRLYAVNENGAEAHLFTIDVAGNKLEHKTKINAASGVVHLEFSKDRNRMVGSGYGNASIDIYDTSNGDLKLIKNVKSTDNHGPDTKSQAAPHPHQAVLDPTGKYFAVNDLGTDKILILDSTGDSFSIVNRVPVEPAGCGPRHGAFFPVGAAKATHYILVCEIKNLVKVYSLTYGGEKGIEFKAGPSLSTFKGAAPEKAAAGELVIAPDNKNVYVSNRLAVDFDTIANFRVAGSPGNDSAACSKLTLELVGLTSTGGKRPRMFSITSDGQTLLVGNQEGELGVVALKRNQDGTLAEKPIATIPASEFPGGKGGPAYIQQIA